MDSYMLLNLMMWRTYFYAVLCLPIILQAIEFINHVSLPPWSHMGVSRSTACINEDVLRGSECVSCMKEQLLAKGHTWANIWVEHIWFIPSEGPDKRNSQWWILHLEGFFFNKKHSYIRMLLIPAASHKFPWINLPWQSEWVFHPHTVIVPKVTPSLQD